MPEMTSELKRVPQPAYRNHPAYGGLYPRASLGLTLQALKKIYPHLKSLWKSEAMFKGLMEPVSETQRSNPELPKLERNGAIALRLSPEHKAELLALCRPHLDKVIERRKKLDPQKRGVENCSEFLANWRETPKSQGFLTIDRILEETGIYDLCHAYRGYKLSLKSANVQVNDHTDGCISRIFTDLSLNLPSTYYFHMDSELGTMKLIAYLNDVDERNGPFRYVLTSNRVKMSRFERCVRKASDKSGLDWTGAESRKLFMALPSFMRKKCNFGNDLLDGSAESERLLKLEKRFFSSDGDLILFDNEGIHRGAIFESGERHILQILLRPRGKGSKKK